MLELFVTVLAARQQTDKRLKLYLDMLILCTMLINSHQLLFCKISALYYNSSVL